MPAQPAAAARRRTGRILTRRRRNHGGHRAGPGTPHAFRRRKAGDRVSLLSRRAVLAMPLAAAARTAPAIRRIEVFPAPYPVTAYFKFFAKPERPTVFVKITCEDGTAGWGQSVPIPTWSYETPESVMSA